MSCQYCGSENPDGFRFCGACGARLPTVEPGGGDERKVISALFCDVVESTARAERVDPEDVRNVLSPYYEGVRTHLVRFGGTVEKFIGDAVCGLFGAPRTHGDDPERAVRAALAIRDWIAELNEADPRLELHVRLAVATGDAVVALGARAATGEAMAWGDVMNTAARLQTAAPVDSVLIDEPTYRATRHAIEYEVAEPVQAKGKSELVAAWQALAPRARRGVDLSQEEGREPFVGRADELQLLRESLHRAGRMRAPELVAFLGESGIGKSRLAFELFRWVEHQPEMVHWRQAGTSPYGDVLTYGALGEIVKAQAGVLETDSASVASDKLAQTVAAVVPEPADAARIEAHLRSLVGLEAPAAVTHGDQRQAAFVAWRRFLEAVAQEYTLVLVFEDVQWADTGLLDFIEHLLDWSRGVGTLVICTARPEFAEMRPGWWARDAVTMIPLSPLPNENIAELVTILAPDPIPSQTRDAIVGAASGNPLFAIEFTRMLVDRLEQPPTAESVRGVIASRLDALSAEDKLLLQDAAVAGSAVWPGVLAKAGDRSRRFVEERLRELVRREFLARVTPSSVQGEPEFKFRHDLVRDVAYEQIPRRRRAEIHRRTAEWLDSLSPDRAKDRAEMLALHYVSAYEYARASNADAEELVESARRSLRNAGDRALTLNAFATAERHYRDALELWPEQDPERAMLLFNLGKACYYSNVEDADLFVEAERLLLDAGDRESAAEAAAFRADLAHLLRMPQETMFEHAFRALDLVEGGEMSRAKAQVLLDVAILLTLAADQERAIELASEARRGAEALGLAELEAAALATLGAARTLSGDSGGLEDLRRSIEITEEIDSPLGSHHFGMLADVECSLGHLADCYELQARAREHAERFGHSAHIQWLKAERVAECYWTGDWNMAVALADGFLSEAETGSGHFMEPYCHAVRGRIRLARGELADALDDTLKAVEKARDSGQPQMLCPALAVRARALVAAGARDDAAQAVDELLALWTEKLNLFLTSAWVVDLGWALDDLGRGAELREIAASVRARTAWLEAAIACTTGGFDVAAGILAEIGSRPDEALARLRSAQVFSASGHEVVARQNVERALAFFAETESLAYLTEAEAVPVG
jgi:class 3 adenylate cyclase/tetratricopeptide (TPR) repeat protein